MEDTLRASIISKAIEDGYKDFTMQHKYPFVVLYLDVDTEHVDVNVHPTKMDVRLIISRRFIIPCLRLSMTDYMNGS